MMDAIESTALNFTEWMKDYEYDRESNEYFFRGFEAKEEGRVDDWLMFPVGFDVI
ncbi:MAG: hypothetical protein ABI707_20670 [Ferruginibacter sp.]